MPTLFTPWRYGYIVGEEAQSEGCFLCAASAAVDDPESLVVHHDDHHFLLLNKFPYASGHLMLAPRRHLASPDAEGDEAQAAFWPLALRAKRVLERLYRPDGVNLGMNLGRAAGAGAPDHYHLHLVPRWSGDTNFMSVVAGVRLVPEELHAARTRLREAFGEG